MLEHASHQSHFKLTCSVCGESARLRLPGVTERTRYTCPECCERISAGRGNRPRAGNPFALREDPEIRQIALRRDISRNSQTGLDDVN